MASSLDAFKKGLDKFLRIPAVDCCFKEYICVFA